MESGCEMTNAQTFETNKAYMQNPSQHAIRTLSSKIMISATTSIKFLFLMQIFLANADQWHSGLQLAQVHARIHRRRDSDRNVSQL
jgi:hypothetical protein